MYAPRPNMQAVEEELKRREAALRELEQDLKRREAVLRARERQELLLRSERERPVSPFSFGSGAAAEEEGSPQLRTSKHAARSPRKLPRWLSPPREPGGRRYADAPESRARSVTPPLLARSRTPSMTPPLQNTSLTPRLATPILCRREGSPEASAAEDKAQACASEDRSNAAPEGGVSGDDALPAVALLSRSKRTAAEACTGSAQPDAVGAFTAEPANDAEARHRRRPGGRGLQVRRART